tara:strand:+ start:545 stop:739 length:195 start_codon:yes stop_codon:yes gene_type:complete
MFLSLASCDFMLNAIRATASLGIATAFLAPLHRAACAVLFYVLQFKTLLLFFLPATSTFVYGAF